MRNDFSAVAISFALAFGMAAWGRSHVQRDIASAYLPPDTAPDFDAPRRVANVQIPADLNELHTIGISDDIGPQVRLT